MQIFKSVITNILIALYQPFWFAVILSALYMFVWKNYKSVKSALKQWIHWFKTESSFRRMFLFVFYIVMILFRTLINRNMWQNPLQDIMGTWWLYKYDSTKNQMILTTEVLENLALFIPFAVLLLWTYRDKILNKVTLVHTLWQSTKIVFLFSFSIEFLQLFLRLGTWQLSDLFYNTVGGFIGGLVYWIGYRIKHRGAEL